MVRLDTVLFLSTIQLLITDASTPHIVKGFGSGFFLWHRERCFFITADHVLHTADHDTSNESGQRTGLEDMLQIITNVTGEVDGVIGLKNIPLGGFYNFTKYGLGDCISRSKEENTAIIDKIIDGNIDLYDESLPIDVRISDLYDIAICEIKQFSDFLILNTEVVSIDGDIVVKGNTCKIPISSDDIKEFNKENSYFVAGRVHNEIRNTMTIYCDDILHEAIVFDGFYDDNFAKLRTEEPVDINDWYGLSGAPIFDDNGQLAGMLVRGPKEKPYATAIPIKEIIQMIDIIIRHEDNIQAT